MLNEEECKITEHFHEILLPFHFIGGRAWHSLQINCFKPRMWIDSLKWIIVSI